jgi:T-complex protein 1 subunit theta
LDDYANDLLQNENGTGTLDTEEEGILDLLVTKQWAIKLATEAARTVLSVDQIIVARQAGGPKPPGPNPVSSSLRWLDSSNRIANIMIELGRGLSVE